MTLLDDIIKKIYEKSDVILVQSKTFKNIIDKSSIAINQFISHHGQKI